MAKSSIHRITAALAVTTALGAGIAGQPANASETTSSTTAPGAVTPVVPNVTTFAIHNVNATGKCIGIAADGIAGDWNCTGHADQTWHKQNFNSVGFYQLVNNNGACLSGGNDTQGAAVYATTCNTGDFSQFWSFATNSYISNYAANVQGFTMVIGVYGGSTNNGAALVMWPPKGHTDQFWY